MTLTFDLSVILIGQGGRFNFKWPDVSTRHGVKVVCVLLNVKNFQWQQMLERSLRSFQNQ